MRKSVNVKSAPSHQPMPMRTGTWHRLQGPPAEFLTRSAQKTCPKTSATCIDMNRMSQWTQSLIPSQSSNNLCIEGRRGQEMRYNLSQNISEFTFPWCFRYSQLDLYDGTPGTSVLRIWYVIFRSSIPEQYGADQKINEKIQVNKAIFIYLQLPEVASACQTILFPEWW